MYSEQEGNGSSLHGRGTHRRQREVHKIRLSDLPNVTPEEIASMVASGDIELLVRRSDVTDGDAGGWGRRVGRLFEEVAGSIEGAPEHENRTIIVNIVCSGSRPGDGDDVGE